MIEIGIWSIEFEWIPIKMKNVTLSILLHGVTYANMLTQRRNRREYRSYYKMNMCVQNKLTGC